MGREKNRIWQKEENWDKPTVEKIRKEKRSVRGRTTDDWLIDDLKTPETLTKILANEKIRRGRVIEVHKKHAFVAEENEAGVPDTGALWLCTVAKRHFQRSHKERNFVVVGDRILFEPDREVILNEAGEPINSDLPHGVIQHSLIRRNRLARKDPMHEAWEHVMLCNVDLIAIVASVLNPEVRWGLIDRMLVQAELENIEPIIILNKIDLLKTDKATPEFLEIYQKRVEIYRNIGYRVYEICALHPKKTFKEVQQLKTLFKRKLIGFCGHSGVGKSSVVNLMSPEFEQIVDDDPEIFYKGRHTTTYNTLLRLGIGAYAIDTPGIRSFGTEPIDAVTLSSCFREFSEFRCKYRECSHHLEEECAIKDAIKEGKISEERYRSYLGILKGVTFREGEGDNTDATEIADLKARELFRDQPEAFSKGSSKT